MGDERQGVVQSDAELLVGFSRHLAAFQLSPATERLDGLRLAGRVLEFAWRLRGSGLSSAARVEAIALQARIGGWDLRREVLPLMETLGWIEVQEDDEGNLVAVSETVPPMLETERQVSTLLRVCSIGEFDEVCLALFRETTLRPLTKEGALDLVMERTGGNERVVLAATDSLLAVRLIVLQVDAGGREVLFNPNVWTSDSEAMSAALKAEDARVNKEVGSLIEEVAQREGLPESHVASTEQRWIDFAVNLGLVLRSVVQTSDGSEQRFLFTPHLSRDPFGGVRRDPSGHTRQLVGSMVYAATFPSIKLRSPTRFLQALIRDGVAGDATPIGTDYPMLETAGIVRIVPGSSQRKHRFELLQADIAEEALEILEERSGISGSGGSASAITDQRFYVHAETERARLAVVAADSAEDQARLVAALRDTIGKRDFRG